MSRSAVIGCGTWWDLLGPLDQPVEFRDDAICAAGFQLLREFQLADQDADLAIESLSFEIIAAVADHRQLTRTAACRS